LAREAPTSRTAPRCRSGQPMSFPFQPECARAGGGGRLRNREKHVPSGPPPLSVLIKFLLREFDPPFLDCFVRVQRRVSFPSRLLQPSFIFLTIFLRQTFPLTTPPRSPQSAGLPEAAWSFSPCSKKRADRRSASVNGRFFAGLHSFGVGGSSAGVPASKGVRLAVLHSHRRCRTQKFATCFGGASVPLTVSIVYDLRVLLKSPFPSQIP